MHVPDADLLFRPAHELAGLVHDGELSARELVTASLERIEALDDQVGAFVDVDGERALAAADAVGPGDARPFAGVPIAVKNNRPLEGLRLTFCADLLGDHVAGHDAHVVRRLREAGFIVVGTTKLPEFGILPVSEPSRFGPTRNPWDLERTPGGSSGGSAAAVAAGLAYGALGSDTGGSIRSPAVYCGITGLKPTYGRVSRFGLVAFASSLDQIGVLGRTVDDAALALEVIAGFDERDSTTGEADVPIYRMSALGRPVPQALDPDTEATRIGRTPVPLAPPPGPATLEGIVIGKPREYFPDNLDPAIRDLCERSFDRLQAMGAVIRDVSLPRTALAIPTYYIIAPAEASSNLARFDGVRYGLRVAADRGLQDMYEQTRSRGFGPEVTRRVLLGTYVLSAGYYDAYYKKAQAVRTLIAADFSDVFGTGVHALFTPTAPTTAFRLGAVTDPYEMYLNDIFTATANLAGVPAMSIPIGRVRHLPVGGQVIAAHFDEYNMFRVAYALEASLGAEAHA